MNNFKTNYIYLYIRFLRWVDPLYPMEGGVLHIGLTKNEIVNYSLCLFY